MSSLWAFWAPPAERSRLVGVGNAGSQIGNVLNEEIINKFWFNNPIKPLKPVLIKNNLMKSRKTKILVQKLKNIYPCGSRDQKILKS